MLPEEASSTPFAMRVLTRTSCQQDESGEWVEKSLVWFVFPKCASWLAEDGILVVETDSGEAYCWPLTNVIQWHSESLAR